MPKEHLLVVEDEADSLELWRHNLAQEGCRLTRVIEGEEGLRAARSTPHDLIVLDLRLTVCLELKQDARTREIGPDIFAVRS